MESNTRIKTELEAIVFYNPRYEINKLIKEGNLRDLLIKAAELHGHFCVGLALGVKASLIALEKLGIEIPLRDVSEHIRHELIAIVDNNLCFIDGVQMIIGSTLGNNSLIFRDAGKLSLILIDKRTKRAIRISLTKNISTPTLNNPKFNEYFKRAMIRKEKLSNEELEEFRSLMDKASLEVLNATWEGNYKIEELNVENLNEIEKRDSPTMWVNCKYCGTLVMESKAYIRNGEHYCADCAGEESYAVVGRKIMKFRLEQFLHSSNNS